MLFLSPSLFFSFPFSPLSPFSAHLLHSDTGVSAEAHQLSPSADRDRGCSTLFSLLECTLVNLPDVVKPDEGMREEPFFPPSKFLG